MRAFADLYSALDETTKTNAKVAALTQYFEVAPPRDAAWAVHFLIGRRPKRLIETRKLVEWAIEEAAVPDWLFGESYQAVGDLAETISLLLPAADKHSDAPLHYWVEEVLLPLRQWDDTRRREVLIHAWREMDERQRFVWNKLITGAFRVGVSQSLVVRALAQVSGVEASVISHRLMGDWQPTADFTTSILAKEMEDADVSRPYPFCLAYPLEASLESLGDRADWNVEWKWDGIRSQVIRRQFQTYIWSRGEELMAGRFPELEAMGASAARGHCAGRRNSPVARRFADAVRADAAAYRQESVVGQDPRRRAGRAACLRCARMAGRATSERSQSNGGARVWRS